MRICSLGLWKTVVQENCEKTGYYPDSGFDISGICMFCNWGMCLKNGPYTTEALF